MPGIAGAIENERFMALHGARVLSRRNSPLARAKKSAPETVENVIRKLKEEAARGHETVTFIIAFSFGLLKDFGIDGMRVVTRMAVETSTRGTANIASTGLSVAGWVAPWVGGAIGTFFAPGPGTAIGTGIGKGVGYVFDVASYGVGYFGEATAVSGGRAVDLTFLCISLMVSAGIFVLMWGKGWFMKTKVKYAWWGLGFFVDNLPKVNALPLTTMSIAYTWIHVKRRARAAEKKLADIEKLTQNEIEDLDQDISILDKER